MKKLLVSLFLVFGLLGCEDDTVEARMTYDGESIVEDTVKTWQKKKVADLIYSGAIFEVTRDEIAVTSSLDIGVNKLAVIVCDPFGWGSEYDWLCTMDGTKGRVIARDDSPVDYEDFVCYLENQSESYPGDILSTTYYNADTYPFAADTSVNFNVLRGVLSSWSAAWNNARIDFCDVGNPNGTHVHCNQD